MWCMCNIYCDISKPQISKLKLSCVYTSRTYKLLTKSFGFKEPRAAFGASSKSCGLDVDAVLGVWMELFQIDVPPCAIYCNI